MSFKAAVLCLCWTRLLLVLSLLCDVAPAFGKPLNFTLIYPPPQLYSASAFGLSNNKKLCGRPPQYAPAPCDLDLSPLLTLKVVSESRVHDVGYFYANFSRL